MSNVYPHSATLTEKIFQLSAPYDNPYQGTEKRLLFVCSAGLLRSPTGAAVYAQRGFNTRSCGSNQAYALINLSVNLIMWANKIVFVNEEDYRQALQTFEAVDYVSDINERAIVLNIPDDYEYRNEQLVKHFERQLDPVLS